MAFNVRAGVEPVAVQAAAAANHAPVIFTVHGTNDAHPDDAGSCWWQRDSLFARKLISQLAVRGIFDADIRPIHWSGANSDFDRFAGARLLARGLAEVAKSGRAYAVIGHSHGGNVAMEALAEARAVPGPGGVVTFGTPFFERRLKLVPLIVAVFQILMGLVIAPTMAWALMDTFSSGTTKVVEVVVFIGGLLLLALWSLKRGVEKILRRAIAVRRLARAIKPDRWLVVHSPRDEAMRILEAAAQIEPRYVTTSSAIRSLNAFAALAGVAGTVALFAWHANYFLDPIRTKISEGRFDLGVAADFTFLLLMPVVYCAIYAVVALFAQAGGGWLYAQALSRAIHGGVLGAAFGGDAAWQLKGVVRHPPYLDGVAEDRIEAMNLGGIDDAAVFVAAHKLYDSVVALDGRDGGIGDPDAMWKRLSDALYHNAYMRDDAVIARVADHLAAGWRSPRD